MKYILLMVLMLSTLTGCETVSFASQAVGKGAAAMSSYSQVKKYYDDGNIIVFLEQAELNDMELNLIIEAMAQVDRTQARLEMYKDDPSIVLDNMELLKDEYNKLKEAYIPVRNIVLAHEKEYDLEAWLIFVRFDSAANTLNDQFIELVDATETNAAIMTALKFSDTVLKIASLM